MLFWTIIKVALKSLFANKLRSFLAMLGIIIGVGAVISMLALGAGAQRQVLDRISAMGTDLLIIRPTGRGSGGVISGTQQNLTVEDAAAILREVPGVESVAPVVNGSVQAKRLNRNSRTTAVGTTPTYLQIRNFEIERGRAFNDIETERLARVAIIGPATAEAVFGPDDPLDDIVKLNGVSFRVIGVLKSKGDQGWFNPDDQVILPYTTAMKQLFGLDYVREIDVQAAPGKALEDLQRDATTVLRRRHRLQGGMPDDFTIRNQAEVLEAAEGVTKTFTILLGGIAGISLLVGGIGIMNIMLVTVTERTREIGVRKAIGAKDRDIMLQFLIEAVLMSGVGGMLGILLGLGGAAAVERLTQFTPLIQLNSIVMAAGFSAAVGIFFGFYPARRAAQLDPIDALRYE